MGQDLGTSPAAPHQAMRTKRLLLRVPGTADAPAIAELANDPGVAEMLARLPHPYSREDADAFVRLAASSTVFVVTDNGPDGVVMGVCGVRPTDRRSMVDLGYWIGRRFWGNGYATEAAQAVVDLAFAIPEVDLVFAGCRAVNARSRRVLEKCGFQFRGTGSFVSMAAGRVASEQFGLDRRTWRSLKAWASAGIEAR